MKKHKSIWLALLVAFSLVAAACGDSDDAGSESADTTAAAETTAAPETTEAAETTAAPETTEAMDDEMAMVGEGVSITMAKADWSTEDPNAYVARAILQEMGYEVSDPAELTLGPSNAYVAMAQGDADFWINSWMPGHSSWLANTLPDDSAVGDHVTVIGEMMLAGGLQGFLMTKSFSEEFGITTMEEFNDNPDAIAAYDAQDPAPGNGFADIYGCQDSWTCDDIILAQIAFGEYENIQQTIAGYDAMFAEATVKANADEPMVIYTWTPSAYITELRPSDNVVWLGMENILDDSNPTGADGGEGWDQRPGTAGIGPDSCPASQDGTCPLGWVAADIRVSVNNDFADANPAAATFLELFQMSVLDVSLMNVDMGNGSDVEDLAAGWIEANRDLVDGWIAAAEAAA